MYQLFQERKYLQNQHKQTLTEYYYYIPSLFLSTSNVLI